MHAIRDKVAVIRGLPVNDGVHEGTMSRENYRDYLFSVDALSTYSERTSNRALSASLQQMQLLAPGEDLAGTMLERLGSGVAGLYDHRNDSLVVLDDVLGDDLLAEETIAHEYTHALQDGAFDLQKLYSKEPGLRSEYGVTLDCVVEGDAVLTASLYMESIHGPDWTLEHGGLPSIREDPSSSSYTAFTYGHCASFVIAVWEKGGWEAVNKLFAEPPASTEQIFEPEKYIAGEGPKLARSIDVGDSIGSGWRLVAGGAFGALDLQLLVLAIGGDVNDALHIAGGWGGGELSVYSSFPDPSGFVDDVISHIALVWDSRQDFERFRESYPAIAVGLGAPRADLATADRSEWRGRSGNDFGANLWDAQKLRVDILFGTDEDAIKAATDALEDYARKHR
jgi:hypothetical protein